MARRPELFGKTSSRRLGALAFGCCFLLLVLTVNARRVSGGDVSGANSTSVLAVAPTPALLDTSTGPSAELMHDAPLASPTATLTLATDARADSAHSRTVWMEVTAYCSCKKCCGPRACGITASGRPTSFNNGCFVAADTALFAFGTQLQIPGYAAGQPVPVIDRGSAIKGNHIDVFFATHDQALAWGRRWIAVTIVGK